MVADILRRSELQRFPVGDLQRYGETHFANLDYRTEVARRLALSTGTSRLITFDDVINAVPEAQRTLLHGLPGYERHLLHTLLLAPGFENGAVAISSAPPNPVEMGIIRQSKARLEQHIKRQIPFEILFFYRGSEHDLMRMSERDYVTLCANYADQMGNPQNAAMYGSETYLPSLAQRNISRLTQGKPSLTIPFEMTEMHREYLGRYVKLPDTPIMDKVYNKLLLGEKNFQNVNSTIAVIPRGDSITNFRMYQEYKKYTETHRVPRTAQNISNFAYGVIRAVDTLARQGKKAYIKLDSEGVSGLSNLDPTVHTLIYDTTASNDSRVQAVINILTQTNSQYLPDAALVEELVKPKDNQGVKRDATYGGLAINGEFYPTSVFPFGTDKNGVYTHGWISNNPSQIGEDANEWKRGYQVFETMTKYLGIQTGIVAGDVFTTQSGGLLVHDWNLRRGGRSHVEAFIALNNGGWFEVQIEVPIEKRVPNRQMYEVYNKVCFDMASAGIAPYSTSFGYFGKSNEHDFMKFKLLVPMERLTRFGFQAKRADHHSMVEQHISQLVHNHLR